MTQTLNRIFPEWGDETLNHMPKEMGLELTCKPCQVKWVGNPYEDTLCWSCGEVTGKPKFSSLLGRFKKIPTPTL